MGTTCRVQNLSRVSTPYLRPVAPQHQRVLERLGVSALITSSTPIDEAVIGTEAFRELAVSHWRKMSSSSPIYKLDQRDYYRS